MVLISFSCYPTCARLWYVIPSEVQWRETGHDALRCVRRIVLLNAGLAVHARIHMHDWYGARVLSMFSVPTTALQNFWRHPAAKRSSVQKPRATGLWGIAVKTASPKARGSLKLLCGTLSNGHCIHSS